MVGRYSTVSSKDKSYLQVCNLKTAGDMGGEVRLTAKVATRPGPSLWGEGSIFYQQIHSK